MTRNSKVQIAKRLVCIIPKILKTTGNRYPQFNFAVLLPLLKVPFYKVPIGSSREKSAQSKKIAFILLISFIFVSIFFKTMLLR